MKQLMEVRDVARQLSVSPARIYEMARCGLLPVVRLGRQVKVDPDALGEWIRRGGRGLPGGWRKEAM